MATKRDRDLTVRQASEPSLWTRVKWWIDDFYKHCAEKGIEIPPNPCHCPSRYCEFKYLWRISTQFELENPPLEPSERIMKIRAQREEYETKAAEANRDLRVQATRKAAETREYNALLKRIKARQAEQS